MSSTYRLLVSGIRSTYTSLSFDPDTRKIEVLADYPAPLNATWVEPIHSASSRDVSRLIGTSETVEMNQPGMVYTFEIDHTSKTCTRTSESPTGPGPAHFTVLRDRSAVATATYLGGDLSLHPVTWEASGGLSLVPVTPRHFAGQFAYDSKSGPVSYRQRQCHWHQVLEDKRELLYALDLGSDRVWVLQRDGLDIRLVSWLQCPGGTGPRHATFNHDETILYVLGEMSHEVTAYDLSHLPSGLDGVAPMYSFGVNIIPPSVKPGQDTMMDSAEIVAHTSSPHVLYVSNRWERHIAARQPELALSQESDVSGDSIAIILLTADGRAVERTRHVRTKLDVVRGMRLSPDGTYVALAGQEGGGVEIYSTGAERGESWALVAELREGMEGGLMHVVWL